MSLTQTLNAPLDTLVQQVLGEACERGLKLSTAESCTGGLLASVLTDVPGRSHAFERGFVAYTDTAKADLLGVPPDMIKRYNAVSDPVARAMAGRPTLTAKQEYGDIGRERVREQAVVAGLELFRSQIV